MNRIASFLLVFLSIFTSAASADVVVYKGSIRLKRDVTDFVRYPPVVRLYFIVDYSTGATSSVTYFVKNGKRYEAGVANFNLSTATLPNGKPLTILGAVVSTNTSLHDFSHIFVYLKGVNAVLKTQQTPSPDTLVRPKALTGRGSFLTASTDSNGRIQEAGYSMVFHSALTVAANNANKTVTVVRDEIIADLEGQGYSD